MPGEDRFIPHPQFPDKYYLNLDTRDVIDRETHQVVPRMSAQNEGAPQQEAPLPGGGRDLSTRTLTPEQQQSMLQQTGMGSLRTLPTAQGVSPKPTLESVRDISGAAPLSGMVVDPAIDYMQGDTLGNIGKQYVARPVVQMLGETAGGAIGGRAGRVAGGALAMTGMELKDRLMSGELSISDAVKEFGWQTVNNLLGNLVSRLGSGPSATKEPFVKAGKEDLETAKVKESNVITAETKKRAEQEQALPGQMETVQQGIADTGKNVALESQGSQVAELGKQVTEAQEQGIKAYDKTVEGLTDTEVEKYAKSQADDAFSQWYKKTFGRDLRAGQEEARSLASGSFTPAKSPLPQDPTTRDAVWRPFQAVFNGVRGVREGFTEQYEGKVKPELQGKLVPSSTIEGILTQDLASSQQQGTAPPLHTGPVNMFLNSLREIQGQPNSPIVTGPNGQRAYPAEWLLGRSSELAQLLHSRSTPDPEKHVLGLIKEQFDKHLNALSPSYGETTAQYSNTARIGLFDLANDVGKAQRGLDIPPMIFQHPEAAQLLVSRMDNQAKGQLRELTGLSLARAYSGEEPPSTLSHLLNRDNEATYRDLFKGTGIPDANHLFWYAKEANAFGEAIDRHPELRKQAQQAVEQKALETFQDFSRESMVSFEANLKDWAKGSDSKADWARRTLSQIGPVKGDHQKMILLDKAIQQFIPMAKPGLPSDLTGGKELVDSTRSLLKKLPGPVGQEYESRFQQAESLPDQLAIVRELGSAQNLPQGVQKAVSALKQHFTPLADLSAEELTSLYRDKHGEPPIPIRTPQDYAVAKRMRNDISIPQSWFEKSLGFHVALGGMLSLMGHTPVWLLAEGMVGAGDKVRQTARKAFGESLRDEKTAREFIDGLENFKDPSQKEKLMRQFAGAVVSSALNDAEDAIGVKP